MCLLKKTPLRIYSIELGREPLYTIYKYINVSELPTSSPRSYYEQFYQNKMHKLAWHTFVANSRLIKTHTRLHLRRRCIIYLFSPSWIQQNI